MQLLRSGLACFASVAVAMVWQVPLMAGEPGEFDHDVVSLQIENDLFGDGFDRHYTNGLRLSWVSGEKELSDWVHALPEQALELVSKCDDCKERYSLALGHNIYTPEEITRSELIEDDRPYAGWLYLGAGLMVLHGHAEPGDKAFRRGLDVLELNVGMVGPDSFADEIQTKWHDIIDTKEPRGWDNQLRNELGVALYYSGQWQNVYPLVANPVTDTLFSAWQVDVIPHWGFALGNVHTHASVGATLRIGSHLEGDFGIPRIRPTLPGGGFFANRAQRWSWYVFAGVEGRGVAQNIFLDGNTFRDSHSVDKKHWVGDFQYGLVLTYGQFRVAFTDVRRSREFDGQPSPSEFGAISVSMSL